MQTTSETKINGIDVAAIRRFRDEVSRDAEKGKVGFSVSSAWQGGTLSETTAQSWRLAGEEMRQKRFAIPVDEPVELGGMGQAPNPQEVLFAALNACMIVGYVAGAAAEGIQLDKVEIKADGELDLRGFLGLDPNVSPGYEKVRYAVHIKGDGTPEQFARIHHAVMATSPNRWNLTNAIQIEGRLVID